MKFSDYVLIFIIIFFGFSVITFRSINTYSESGITSTEYANKLTAACNDAAKTIHLENITKDGIWYTAEDRNETLETFYSTLEFCFNADNSVQENEIKLYTPVVCLVDVNGYYIAYNSSLDETTIDGSKIVTRPTDASNGTIDAKHKKMVENTITVSNLNTWAETYGHFTVCYFLNNHIRIITPNGRVVEGSREEVDQIFTQSIANGKENLYGITSSNMNAEIRGGSENLVITPSIYDLLRDVTDTDGSNIYETFRNAAVVQQINQSIEYYINKQNLLAQSFDIPYQFTMPEIKSEDWCRLLENPTILSFLQGAQMKTSNGYINVYSLAGGELIKEKMYFITEEIDESGNKYHLYHYMYGKCGDRLRKKPLTKTVTVKNGTKTENTVYTSYEYVYTDEAGKEIVVKTFYNSMEECAKRGAYPCECVYNYNDNQ